MSAAKRLNRISEVISESYIDINNTWMIFHTRSGVGKFVWLRQLLVGWSRCNQHWCAVCHCTTHPVRSRISDWLCRGWRISLFALCQQKSHQTHDSSCDTHPLTSLFFWGIVWGDVLNHRRPLDCFCMNRKQTILVNIFIYLFIHLLHNAWDMM